MAAAADPGGTPEGIERLATIVRRACDAADVGGRPFAAALLALGWTDDPLADAWHGAEVLRELQATPTCPAWCGRRVVGQQAHILLEYWYRIGGCGFRRVWGWTAGSTRQRPTSWTAALSVTASSHRLAVPCATRSRTPPTRRCWCPAIADDLDDLARIGEPLSRAVVWQGMLISAVVLQLVDDAARIPVRLTPGL